MVSSTVTARAGDCQVLSTPRRSPRRWLPSAPRARAGGGGRTRVGHQMGNGGTQGVELFLQDIDMSQPHPDQSSVMVPHQLAQSLFQDRQLTPRPLANSTSAAGAARHSINAARMARPDTPMIADAKVMLARSRTPGTRLTSRPCITAWPRGAGRNAPSWRGGPRDLRQCLLNRSR